MSRAGQLDQKSGLRDDRRDEAKVVIGFEKMGQPREEISEHHGAEANFPEHGNIITQSNEAGQGLWNRGIFELIAGVE